MIEFHLRPKYIFVKSSGDQRVIEEIDELRDLPFWETLKELSAFEVVLPRIESETNCIFSLFSRKKNRVARAATNPSEYPHVVLAFVGGPCIVNKSTKILYEDKKRRHEKQTECLKTLYKALCEYPIRVHKPKHFLRNLGNSDEETTVIFAEFTPDSDDVTITHSIRCTIMEILYYYLTLGVYAIEGDLVRKRVKPDGREMQNCWELFACRHLYSLSERVTWRLANHLRFSLVKKCGFIDVTGRAPGADLIALGHDETRDILKKHVVDVPIIKIPLRFSSILLENLCGIEYWKGEIATYNIRRGQEKYKGIISQCPPLKHFFLKKAEDPTLQYLKNRVIMGMISDLIKEYRKEGRELCLRDVLSLYILATSERVGKQAIPEVKVDPLIQNEGTWREIVEKRTRDTLDAIRDIMAVNQLVKLAKGR